MEIGRFERPRTLEEAHTLIVEHRGMPLGGGAWVHMTTKKADLVVDLSGLGLDYIRDAGDSIEIGAMATARALETSPLLAAEFGGLFKSATEHLVGVQLRNIITVGGTVAGKYGFSDLITALAALDASLALYGGKTVDIMGFLTGPRDKPFLLEKIVLRKGVSASFQSLRVTRNDFAILNACAAFSGGAVEDSGRGATRGRPAEPGRGGNSRERRGAFAGGRGSRGRGRRGGALLRRRYPGQLDLPTRDLFRPRQAGNPGGCRMIVSMRVNGKPVKVDCNPGDVLADLLRSAGYAEVKKACGTGNCGLCTVLLDGLPVPSCSVLAGRADGHAITTIRGVEKEAAELARFIAAEGVEQCGFCSPGFALMALAMKRELSSPTDAEIRHYLAGNLCRCSGYEGHMRALRKYLEADHE